VSGVFSRWQPEYAAHGIATFPVGESKKPGIRGWQKVGLHGSAELAEKFTTADALGYVTGRRSNVTVLDIDTTDEKVAEDAIERHGQPIIITRTASGKFHHLYRYNGERRRIRPLPALPIDLLGDNGYTLAAPSKIATGSYEIIHGHLDDLDRLTPMEWGEMREVARGAPREHVDANAPLRGMREHDGRNQALFMALGPIARTVHQASGTQGQLLDIARKHNAQCTQPMKDTEVNRIVDSIWNMTQAGRNVIGLPDAFCLTVDHLEIEDTHAFKLLAFLRAHQGPGALFMCANGLAERFGWTRERLSAARRLLIELGHLKPVRQAGRGHPALFRWGKY
jgi:Bifunctional DNA primase/polymerase, N-terminal